MKRINKNKTFKAILAGVVTCGVFTTLMAKDPLDVLDKSRIAGRSFMPVGEQTYVYHTNGALWMGWDSYEILEIKPVVPLSPAGITRDQTRPQAMVT